MPLKYNDRCLATKVVDRIGECWIVVGSKTKVYHVCGRKKGHEGKHKCSKCGREWENDNGD